MAEGALRELSELQDACTRSRVQACQKVSPRNVLNVEFEHGDLPPASAPCNSGNVLCGLVEPCSAAASQRNRSKTLLLLRDGDIQEFKQLVPAPTEAALPEPIDQFIVGNMLVQCHEEADGCSI